MSSISIFKYEDPSLFLKDAWKVKRSFNKSFTLRAWAKQLGLTSSGTFHDILQGKRPLPKKYVVAISESLKLDSKESLYLETLVDFNKSKSMKMKEHYAERLKSLSPGRKLSVIEIESFNALKNPLNGAIIEMTTLSDFKAESQWIKERLAFKATVHEIKESLELLLDLGLLQIDEKRSLKRTFKTLHSQQDIQNQALREYHKNVMKIASEEIDCQEVEEREYGATAFGIKKESLPKIKIEIRDFINHIMAKYETAEGESEEIYQLATQFFKLTDKKETLQ